MSLGGLSDFLDFIVASNNKLHFALGLCLLVIGLLAVCSLIPRFAVGSWRFRSVDLLADIRYDRQEAGDSVMAMASLDSVKTDSSDQIIDSVLQTVKAGCPDGLTCIEDYSADSTALKYFAEALSGLGDNHKALRIALYGDSFVEGDVFCGALRDTLQLLFGGEGVGYVPITSEVAGFRGTIKHQFEHWRTYSLVSKKDSSESVELGPSGFTFIPEENNWVEYKPSRQRFLREFNTAKVYYRNTGTSMIDYVVDDTVSRSEDLKNSERLQEWRHYGKKEKSLRLQFAPCDSLTLYGASFESGAGVYVDNFSMRGNSGIGLARIPDEMFTDFNRYRDYKLIILQYGLNVVLEDSLNYGWYAVRMIKVVNKIKRVYPKASILLIGVSDRSTNTSGEYKTMRAIPLMRDAQRLIAERTGIAFWDLYAAMGGENSMVRMAEAKPPLAAKDYTHLTFKGGRKLAGLMVKSLLHEREVYKRRKQ